ncbi:MULTISPECIES: ion transporter [unclassified Aureispira]|uniref:ion transporter n=1 Tax=unclassified Aureispira TaxID=2649989 RepID=UPI000697DD2B|nr:MULTISPECIES: ion transporter [unclassified Aureispira]WMX11983.1 ion transporter [Aureispira sp. CCB-E]
MPTKRGLREHIYHFIDNEEEQSFGSQSFELFITGLILLSIVAIVLESFDNLREQYGYYFNLFENITLGIFTIEYILRVSTADYKYKDAVSWPTAAWRFITSGSGIVDLIAIAPIFFHFASFFGLREFAQNDFRFIRILKITRLLRIFKMNSFTNSITVVAEVFTEKRHDLGITLFVTFVLLLVSSTLMWYVEGQEQPELFPNIVASFWWAIATLTTVGYGDVFPITPLGKFLSGLIALLGIGLVALPAGILSSAFIEKLEDGTIKEEEIDNYVPKGNLPQAQFQKVNTKKSDDSSWATNETIETNRHKDCSQHFGKAFVYCPYCGEKLNDDENHIHT